MYIVCSDLEGVFIPEIWINVAEKTGISELRLTTRDISDYDVLMRKRLQILKENHLKLSDIQAVIDTMNPLEGALEFLDWLRVHHSGDRGIRYIQGVCRPHDEKTGLAHPFLPFPDS